MSGLPTLSLRSATLIILALLAPPARPQDHPPATTRPIVDRIPRTTVQLNFIRVPGGRITLPDRNGRPTTHDLKPFLIQATETRWEEWDQFFLALDDRPEAGKRAQTRAGREWLDGLSKPSASAFGFDRILRHARDGFPMCGATPFTVQKYIEWLNETTGKRYRLPTEAEWTYACRAGSPDPTRPTGAALDRVAWFAGNSDDRPHTVATRAPNPWGLYDMLGNLAEWVVRPDGTRVVAGGSYQDEAEAVHDAAREVPDLRAFDRADHPSDRRWLRDGAHIGLRLVRDPYPADEK